MSISEEQRDELRQLHAVYLSVGCRDPYNVFTHAAKEHCGSLLDALDAAEAERGRLLVLAEGCLKNLQGNLGELRRDQLEHKLQVAAAYLAAAIKGAP